MTFRSSGNEAGAAVVARGKIKVDARRAGRKLRDHLLVDLHLYASEIARAAVAMGARALAVTWDADDVELTWAGPPLPPESVARARDHVLGSSDAVPSASALRLLGLGVSAALGLGPAHVDVETQDAAGCWRVRFESKHIDEDATEAAPAPLAIAPPAGLPCPGMRVHVRRRAGLETLRRAVHGDVPREVELLVAATRDANLTVTVNGAAPRRARAPRSVMSVDLDEPSLTRAALEVLEPLDGVSPRTVYLELGVHLAETPVVGVRLPAIDHAWLPLRVLVDASRLPTNASRCEVRLDDPVLVRLRERVPAAYEAALVALAAAVTGADAGASEARGLASGYAVTISDTRREAQWDALAALAVTVFATWRAGRNLTAAEQALLALPLLQSAVGAPMALADLRGGTAERPLLVYAGDRPAAQELAPWLEDVVWRRGARAERALESLVVASANERVAQAIEGAARRRRALEHPPSRPALPASPAYLGKQAFAVNEGPFAGLEGEVALVRREGGYRPAPTARLFVDQRLLESVGLPGVALPVDMALAWPGHIQARLAYDGVLRDEALSRAILYALRVATLAVAESALSPDEELARLAMIAHAGASRTLGDVAEGSSTRQAMAALASRPVWPSTDGTRLSLATIDDYARLTGGLCVGRAGSGKARDGRPVVVAEHGKDLLTILGARATLIDYSRFLAQPAGAEDETLALQALQCPVRVDFTRHGVHGFVGLGPNRKRVLHAGVLLSDEPLAYRNGPVLVVFEDRGAVPTPAPKGLLWSSPLESGTAREEDALLDRVIEQCETGALDAQTAADYLAVARRKLEERAKRAGPTHEWELAMVARLDALPQRIERARAASAKAAILARGPAEIARSGPRTATVTTAEGSVTVTLAEHERARAEGQVLFQGRFVETRAVLGFAGGLGLALTVDLDDEGLLRAFTTLTDAGAAWARSTALAATSKLLEQLARSEALAQDVVALRLCEALAAESEAARASVAQVLDRVSWPAVQESVTLLAKEGSQPFGTKRYAPYRRAEDPSPYDVPALYLPRSALGELQQRVLLAAGVVLIDVSEPIARLQKLRARGATSQAPPPRLLGAAEHPLLRESLAKLGATRLEGEIEITSGRVEVARVPFEGAVLPVDLALPLPVRAIFRSPGPTVSDEEIVNELTLAAVALLRRAGRSLGALPSFVTDLLRTVVVQAVLRGLTTPGDHAFALFPDANGGRRSLAELIDLGAVRRTRDAGPWTFPGHDGAPLLIMSDREATSLAAVLRVQDVTEEVRALQRAHERRTAPPLERVALSADLRAQCIYSFHLQDDESLRGEVGLLRPAAHGQRGVVVHVGKRPLVVLIDAGQWPVAAALDVDGLEPNPAFDALADSGAPSLLKRRLRALITAQSVKILSAPADAAAIVRLPVPFVGKPDDLDEGARAVACIGLFWLAHAWPEAPAVAVEGIDFASPSWVPRVPWAPGRHHRVLPIGGRFWIRATRKDAERALEPVWAHAAERLAALASAKRWLPSVPDAERAAYVWDLRLLGILKDVDPVKELASDRPDAVLMRVVSLRAPQLVDAAALDAPATAPAFREEAPAPDAAVASGDGPPPSDAPPAPSPSVLQGLVRWVVDLVTPEAASVTATETPLTRSLLAALAVMKLSGDPVVQVVEASRGRPVRYEPRTRRLVINVAHASLRALHQHPSRTVLLLAAAVSEINRELVPVTDAEELRVIVDLLRDG